MSDIAPALVAEPINPGLPRHEVSAGALLRQAREAAGLHIAALAVSLKVPVKKLEALESDRLDLLPDAVFARALASSMCRALKIDAAPILER
ncbi:MAG TPA: helix-turn-helix transcriptional regulator, partial [Burkholderiaceae bacterium]|nr:helix-turn-helix transcriptional regulator [Burkholderiaceae bacterium]